MASVFTDLGPGEVVETKTVRGRTSYRVAGNGFDKWFDGTKLGFAEVDHDNSVNLPYDPTPQYGVGALTDSTIQPIHEIDADERLSPADSQSFDDRSESEAGREPGPNPDLFAKSSAYYAMGPDDQWDSYRAGDYDPAPDLGAPTPHQTGPHGLDHNAPELQEYGHPSLQHDDDYHPSDAYGNLDRPYPEDTDHDDGGFSHFGEPPQPYNAQTDWDSMNRWGSHHQADVLEGAPTRFEPNFIVNDTDDEFLHDEDVEADERETTGPEDIVHFASNERLGWAAAVPLLERAAPAILRGVGSGLLGPDGNPVSSGDENAEQDHGTPQAPGDAVGGAMDQVAPDGHPLPIPDIENTGWGSLTQKRGYTEHEAVDWQGLMKHPIEDEGGYEALPAHEWLDRHREPQEGDSDYAHASLRPAGLDARYADIYAAYDPYDKIAQFRHDPEAFINRVGNAEYEGLDPRFGSYVDMVDADEMLRTAAWKDVREKAVRLRKEGRVHVKDVADDRIYASVQGDHGTYDVMIKKGGAFGGFGGGHAITNWHCACEWGKWAFQRRFTFVGRLCSHGYACYQEMQSSHLKGKPQYRKTQPRRAQHVASDQTESDWTVDGNVPTTELNKLRQWAEQPHSTWNGNQAEHNEDVRDAVEKAREEGVDTDQLVASLQLHAAGYFKTAVPGPQLPGMPGDPVEDPNVLKPGNQPGKPNTYDKNYPQHSSMPAGHGSPAGRTDEIDFSNRGTLGDSGAGHDQASQEQHRGQPSNGTATPFGGGAPGGAKTPGPGQPSSPDNTVNGAGAAGKTPGPGQPSSPSNTVATPGAPAGPGQPPAGPGAGSSTIGQGDYKIQSGDTLSDIAQRAGYGDNYKALGDANADVLKGSGGGSVNYDKINAGDTIKVGPPPGATTPNDGSVSGVGPAGTPMKPGAPGGPIATPSSLGATPAGPTPGEVSGIGSAGTPMKAAPAAPAAAPPAAAAAPYKNSQRRHAADPDPNTTPGDTGPDVDPNGGADPITPNMGNPNVNPSGGALNPSKDNAIGGQSVPPIPGAAGPKEQTSGGADKAPGGGLGSALGIDTSGMQGIGQGASQIGDAISEFGGMIPGVGGIASGIGSAISGVGSMLGGGGGGGILGSRELEADRDWFEAAYPDAKYHDHKPFNGTGGENITEWGQSKDNVKDNYADNFEDVTDEPKKTFLEDNGSVEDLRTKGTTAARGITRAGHGPQRQAVQPVVVRERRPRNAAAEANVPDFVDFDPLAPRTAASFDDPYREQAAEQAGILAAANGGDIVRQFQAGGGGAINAPAGASVYDDFGSSPAIRQAMQRTAGRNYSLAEQAALVREGDRGGAGNLDSLQLEGTHYEAMNSVGLW